MAFCSNCGKELENGAKFCSACGTAAEFTAEAAPEEFAAAMGPTKKDLDGIIDKSFGKGLAATICAWFPIASIVAIILGSKSMKIWKEAKNLSQQYGVKLSGKNIAARVLGMVGTFGGIGMTCFWLLYIIIIVAILSI